jgi:glutaredoxin
MKFTVYSKSGCPFCEKIKTILEYHDFDTVVYTLDTNFTREQFYQEFGQGATFPQVILDDTILGGCSESIKYLQENNICCDV